MKSMNPIIARAQARGSVAIGLMLASIIALACPTAHADPGRPQILNGVGIDQKLDAQVPRDLVFRDETGDPVKLGDFLGQRPVVLSLVYYKCPLLCTIELNELTRTMNIMPLVPGQDYEVISVSFDPTETSTDAAKAKQEYIRQLKGANRAAGAGAWHFLTGSAESIRQLAGAVGFHYTFDPKFNQYVHAAGIMVLTPQGRVSRYFYGIDYAPRDLRLALVEASNDKIGSLTDAILLFCYHYDPSTKKYTLAVTNLLRAGAGITILALGSFLFINFKREKAKGAV